MLSWPSLLVVLAVRVYAKSNIKLLQQSQVVENQDYLLNLIGCESMVWSRIWNLIQVN